MQNTTPEKIGHYQILRSLKKGGMGEVFLAYDPHCKREVALKVIREELKEHAVIKERFLREAHVAAQLAHPSIIPIFSIDSSEDRTFYTMPYVDGETLKDILKASYEESKKGEILHPIGSSILALTRIFLSICEAIAYTHSKKIIHRDLKPDNIIVGKYGEVLILDWGLADFAGIKENSFDEHYPAEDYKDLTHPGKVPGTLNYIAPERVNGDPSEVSMDIYSLGVILYQLLTLKIPFQRSTIKSFRKTMHLERLIDPLEAAPYRDIPQHLGDIAKRCLRFSPEERFQTVDEMIGELKSFLEGNPEWIPTALIKIADKDDWEFQENVLLTKHLAITRSPDVMEWVSMMISRAMFTGNTKIEAELQLGPDCQGVGFLLGVPDAMERKGINAGYCLWIGHESCLIHNNIEVMAIPEGVIQKNTSHHIAIEKMEKDLSLFIDHQLICRYISHVPSLGSHIGILCRDADFEMGPLKISIGSQNATVNCLAIPDAFLANKNFAKALLEYRRIANSFAGRIEAREAIFRAGITLIEEAQTRKKKEERERHYLSALDEFGKLRFTHGAPLEYLGKSLVYKATKEIEEEVKCLELCVRKYHRHPLLHLIQDHIAFRMHESASRDRVAAYHFALLALRQLPDIFKRKDHELLIDSLRNHLETPHFMLPFAPPETQLACLLAFWIPKPIALIEMIESSTEPSLLMNAAYVLLSLGFHRWVKENLHLLPEKEEIEIVLKLFERKPVRALTAFFKTYKGDENKRCLHFILDQLLMHNLAEEILPYLSQIPETLEFDAVRIQAHLFTSEWRKAEEILGRYPEATLADEYSPLYSLMGCYLRHSEGKEATLSHFSGCIDLPYPTTSMLLSYYLREKITEKKGWIATAFPWEKIQLQRQLQLYYHCAGKTREKTKCFKQMKKELTHVRNQNSYP